MAENDDEEVMGGKPQEEPDGPATGQSAAQMAEMAALLKRKQEMIEQVLNAPELFAFCDNSIVYDAPKAVDRATPLSAETNAMLRDSAEAVAMRGEAAFIEQINSIARTLPLVPCLPLSDVKHRRVPEEIQSADTAVAQLNEYKSPLPEIERTGDFLPIVVDGEIPPDERPPSATFGLAFNSHAFVMTFPAIEMEDGLVSTREVDAAGRRLSEQLVESIAALERGAFLGDKSVVLDEPPPSGAALSGDVMIGTAWASNGSCVRPPVHACVSKETYEELVRALVLHSGPGPTFGMDANGREYLSLPEMLLMIRENDNG